MCIMSDFRELSNSVSNEKQDSVLELVLAVAKFKNARSFVDEIGEEVLSQLRDGISNALGVVYALGVKGDEFFRYVYNSVYHYNTSIRKGNEAYLTLADFKTAENHLNSSVGTLVGSNNEDVKASCVCCGLDEESAF